MFVLALDTSGISVSVALLEDDTIHIETTIVPRKHHSALILPVIQDIIKSSGIALGEVDIFACTTGPGSFTGLRVGICTVKGFALASGKQVVGVSTLEALAANIAHLELLICPMLDARRNQVYSALYRGSRAELLECVCKETVGGVEEFLGKINEDVIFVGQGALSYRAVINKTLSATACFAPDHQHLVRASAVGLLGLRRYKSGVYQDAFTLHPSYLRS